MRSTTTLLGLAMASISLAQTSTVTLYIPGADTQPLEASIIGSDATATTYILQCIPGTDSDDCGFDGPVTLTEGPKTAAYTFAPESASGTLFFTGYEACSLDGTISAVCVESAGGSDANFPGVSTVTYTGTDMPFMPVIVTAQAAGTGGSIPASTTATDLSTVATSTPGGNTKSSSTGAGGKSLTTSNTSGGSIAQTSASTSPSKSTSSSTAGVPAVTGNAQWLVGGAAMAIALMV